MQLKPEELLWAMDTLTANGHPDPEGLLAKMESASPDDMNPAGVSYEDAAQFGIPYVDEPVMSMFAATKRDIANPDPKRYAQYSRAPIRKRTDAALLSGVQASNPFTDGAGSTGQLLLHRGRLSAGSAKPPSDKALMAEIMDLMGQYK
ncbi:MAG: hypothetical protein BWK73_20205 [Thiothrix lacustris]|uniref:Uncharacterized protein n=1 Tax=Thiothrix lacustris TaxID=525917 RepID=A0A1Y1QP68_9GAMM|nr:MAG: hypothetical protein BWK73_20205 [Thiothrix lacustris]